MFKKLLIFSVGTVLVLASAKSPGVAAGVVWDVYPAMSLVQIQAVVDGATDGDTIYFHAGTYDWSGAPLHPRYASEGAINIVDKTLTILGEKGNLIIGPDSVGPPATMWGANAFFVLDEDTDDDATFIGLNIRHFMRGICSDHIIVLVPNVCEYAVPNARNITIKNCTIIDCDRQSVIVFVPTGNVLIQNNHLEDSDAGSVYFSYRYDTGCPPVSDLWQPDGTSVVVRGNKFLSFGSYGFIAYSTKDFRVENNILVGADSAEWGLYFGGTKKGTVVSSNSVANCRRGIIIEGYYGSPYDSGSEQIIVERNSVSVRPPVSLPNSWCSGMEFNGDLISGHTAVKNEVKVASVSGTGIYSEGHHGYFGLNKVTGTGLAAVYLGSWDYGGEEPAYSHHEVFQANSVNKFIPNLAHYYLDFWTHDNLIFGSGIDPVTYIDEGTNNRITGLTPMPGGIGQALKEARADAMAAAKEIRAALY